MSTKDNKDFITKISKELGIDEKIKWKRLNKTKDSLGFLRTFINDQDSSRLVILEKSNGELSLHSYEKPVDSSSFRDKIGTKEELALEFLSSIFLNELKNLQGDILDYLEDYNEVFESLFKNNDFTPFTKEDLIQLQNAWNLDLFKSHMGDLSTLTNDEMYFSAFEEFLELDIFESMSSSAIGIEYDKENYEFVIDSKNNISFIRGFFGGDWEWPITFYLYLNKETNKIEFFIPKTNNNYYVAKNSAYGNVEDSFDEKMFTKINNANQDKIEAEFYDLFEKYLSSKFSK